MQTNVLPISLWNQGRSISHNLHTTFENVNKESCVKITDSTNKINANDLFVSLNNHYLFERLVMHIRRLSKMQIKNKTKNYLGEALNTEYHAFVWFGTICTS